MNRIYQGRVSKVEIPTSLALSPSAIAPKVCWVRGEKVPLDYDLAALYGVTTFNLNKAVKRNSDRFPADFMFKLTAAEAENLRFQNGISRSGHGGCRYLPYAFTEQGVAGAKGRA